MDILNNRCNMSYRELAICLDALGANNLDAAVVQHCEYICSHALIDTLTITGPNNTEPIAQYNYPNRQWIYCARLTRAMLSLGLMNAAGEYQEYKARELIQNFDERWGEGSDLENG